MTKQTGLRRWRKSVFVIGAMVCAVVSCKQDGVNENVNWLEYNGDGARNHYSALSQITPGNVSKLRVAWPYRSGGTDTVRNRSQMQCNPIIIDGILYGVSAASQPFALDAATGKEIWRASLPDVSTTISRGLTYFSDSIGARLFFGGGKYLYVLDAKTGKVINSFGDSGRINLLTGIRRLGGDEDVSSNTPNTIYNNLLITGARLAESATANLGDIRAFDVYSGKLVWTFKTIPDKNETGYETWPENPRAHFGGANAWAGMAIDRERGIVYAPTGSAAFDFYGGNRKGNNLFANCLLALDASTGKLLWYYQFVHHDIWDRDLPCPPNLVTVINKGEKTDAVVQVTKQGHVFAFNRVTGQPLFPVEEKAFPQEAIEGEFPAPTQPIPLKPLPFTRQVFTTNDFNDLISGKDSLINVLKNARTGSPFIPITGKMTIIFPGTDGGAQWGGAAIDPQGIMYVPAKEIPVYTTLVLAIETTNKPVGEGLFLLHCASCHGADKRGSHDGTYPSLVNVQNKLSGNEIYTIIQKGKGRMSAFSHLPKEHLIIIRDYLVKKADKNIILKDTATRNKTVYRHTGYNRWYKDGYPVNQPPWGTLTAIDLNTGDRKWQVPLGEYPDLTARGISPTGTDNYGGPLVTASGLIFIAASRDEQFRAFDKTDGKILWQTKLPAAGYASPSTYSVNGKQFIVIACGGGKLNTRSGDNYIALSLDD